MTENDWHIAGVTDKKAYIYYATLQDGRPVRLGFRGYPLGMPIMVRLKEDAKNGVLLAAEHKLADLDRDTDLETRLYVARGRWTIREKAQAQISKITGHPSRYGGCPVTTTQEGRPVLLEKGWPTFYAKEQPLYFVVTGTAVGGIGVSTIYRPVVRQSGKV